MGLFHFLIVILGIVAAALVGVILMQQSEGGGLGVGGSPSGLMSARGAADFMTRTTAVLGTLFIVLAISLAVVASNKGKSSTLDTSFKRDAAAQTAPDAGSAPAAVPVKGAPAETAPAKDEIPVTR
jgi:preprotein translocase subunit SecG